MLADRALGQSVSVCSKSVSLGSPCFSTSLETAQGPRQPHGAQTIVIVGSPMSESVRVPGRAMTHDRTNTEARAQRPSVSPSSRLDRPRGHHAHVILAANFALTMFIRKSEVDLLSEFALGTLRGGIAVMNSVHRSILTRALMTGVASLAFVMVSPGGVRAEIVTVQGDDGPAGANGVNPGDNGMPGDDGESVSANAGSTQPITAPLNKATATGGNGGQGGTGGNGGNGGRGGASSATASTAIVSGPAESDAYSYGGSGGAGGDAGSNFFGSAGTGGTGGGATGQSSAMNASASPVLSLAIAIGGAGGSSGSTGISSVGNTGGGATAVAGGSSTDRLGLRHWRCWWKRYWR